jgi:hypothetical protein
MLSRYWEMLNLVGENWENGCFVEVLSPMHEFRKSQKVVLKL